MKLRFSTVYMIPIVLGSSFAFGVLLASACKRDEDTPLAPKAYRFKIDGGVTVQCVSAIDSACGVSLSQCTSGHEYRCLHGLDLELSDPGAPIPAPQAQAQAPGQPQPPPMPAPQPTPPPPPAAPILEQPAAPPPAPQK